MRKNNFITALFSLILSISLSAQNTYYVATDGSNAATATGTSAKPFKTVGKAASVAAPGDIILVKGGTYRHNNFGNSDIWDDANAETITCTGAPGAYITIKPENSSPVIFEFDANYGVFIKDSKYVKFQDFKIRGINNNITQVTAQAAWGLYKIKGDATNTVYTLPFDKTLADAILPIPNAEKPSFYNGRGLVVNSSDHIDITGNEVYDCPASGIRVQQSDYVNVIGNSVHNNTYWTTLGVGAITSAESANVDALDDYKIIIERNTVNDNENRLISWNPTKTFVTMVIDEGSGIFLTRNSDTYLSGKFRIANNIVSNSGAGGITVHFTNRTLVANNTVFKNGTTNDGNPGGIGVNTTDGVIVANNLIYARSNKWAIGTLAQPNTNLTVTNNIVHNENSTTVAINNNIATGWVSANPLFVNANGSNFNLQSNSTAINNANATYTPAADFYGNARVGTADIGAIEYMTVLPVELINFRLTKKENTTQLTWQTASETNNKQFDIERSTDAKTWQNIGTVKGQGNFNTHKNYKFTDEKPQLGINYYRLRQVDFDGKSELSTILSANFSSKTTPSVFPNPFTKSIVVDNVNDNEIVTVYDALGRQVANYKAQGNSMELDLANLPSNNFYFIKINNTVTKIIKE
jgi:parallel beta-helix repeat protein